MNDTCGLTFRIAEQFILVSAENTQSETSLWFITNVEDGPAVFIQNLSVTSEISAFPTAGSLVSLISSIDSSASTLSRNSSEVSVSPSIIAVSSPVPLVKLYNSSVILNMTVYVDTRSMALITGSYVEFIRHQTMISKLLASNITELEWTGFAKKPTRLDANIIESSLNETQATAVTAGAVSSIVILGTMATGLGAFIVIEATLNSAASIAGVYV